MSTRSILIAVAVLVALIVLLQATGRVDMPAPHCVKHKWQCATSTTAGGIR